MAVVIIISSFYVTFFAAVHRDRNLTQYCAGDQIEKNEMDGACSTCGGEKRRGVYRVLVGKREEKNHL